MPKKSIFIALCAALLVPFIQAQSSSEYQVTTVLKNKFFDKNGNPLTGKGIVIGDVDSGIDIFHPMFFFADGGEFNWIDADDDGKLTLGTDGVDLNGNGKIDPDETLRYLEIKDFTYQMLPGMNPNRYDQRYDFLYADLNGNKRRDYGPGAGFTENDPCYGEPFFIVMDSNNNGKLDKGEKLVMLKTSKVRTVRERDGTVKRRGIDLIYTEEDSSGHGTGVAGLILGGHSGVEKIQGIAPDAEIVVASVRYNYTPRFVSNFPELIDFLKNENINILLFEDGEWMWEFMDDSSPEEQMVDKLASEGMLCVGGAGNFADGNMMIIDTINVPAIRTYKIECPEIVEDHVNNGVFASFLWKDDAENTFTIQTPDGKSSPELKEADFIKVGKYNIAYAKETSPKGTNMFKLGFSRFDSGSVDGTWKITVKNSAPLELRGYVVDVSQGWEGTSHWVSPKVTGESSVCFPSTADSIVAVGAYVVNWGWFDKIGDLASYSSRGYNIDGKMGVDITAPGHTTFTTKKDFGWDIFSGTSSAAPHVVGLAALMLQYDPALTQTEIKEIISSTAAIDKFTGNVPNPSWGYGKLDMDAALKYLTSNY
jgi:subtilisin family serine protease